MSELPYTGPSVGEMIRDHTLTDNIITRQNGPEHERIFDDGTILRLQHFITHPEEREAIIEEEDLLPDPPGTRIGQKAGSKGDLVGFIVVRYGTEDPALTQEEVERLRTWFEGGMQDE